MHLAQISGLPTYSYVFQSSDTLIGTLLSRVLLFAIIAAGLYFFVRLVLAGFSLMTAGGDSGKIQAATKSLTSALIGFLIVFTAYFIAQIMQTILGIHILT